MSETELTRLVAETIHASGCPDIVAAVPFGGGTETPGIRIEHAGGGTTYLVLTPPARSGTTADVVEFLNFVAGLLHRAQRPEILRVEAVLTALDHPSGLRVTTAAGDVRVLRVLRTEARPVTAIPITPATSAPNAAGLRDAFPRAGRSQPEGGD
ncbi:hypothetical protein ABNF97_09210 [Plantactinospora sp. B6F1]|uniref:hypothetical protein n=1 Tax=Plantactinospora sp. B6F1 TaxID=3158971 RepID=UPI0032D9644B